MRAPGATSDRFAERHYALLAAAILGLALFNLTFRLGREFVMEWDESLYAVSAWEAVRNGSWLGTTFFGQLDYYNSKPPLLIWVIALTFKAFGPGIAALRLVPALSAVATVGVVQWWTKRCFGALAALLAGLVLATTYGFIYVHSGRSAATDAPFTLILTLVLVTCWAEASRPSRRVWLGPLLAAAFLFRGMGVLLPLLVAIACLLIDRPRARVPWRWTVASVALFVVPVGLWVVARYRLDGWEFLRPLFMYDFIARTMRPIEEHPGGPFFYLNELQKGQYDWLFVLGLAWLLFLPRFRRAAPGDSSEDSGARRAGRLLIVYAVVVLVVPSLMQTKVPWYLNTFFPVFAIAVARSVRRGVRVGETSGHRARVVTLAVIVVLAAGAAEARLWWYSFHYRDLRFSQQSLVLDERDRLRGQRVYFVPLSRAAHFVAEAIVGARPQHETDLDSVMRVSRPGDYVVTDRGCAPFDGELVRATLHDSLCLRR